MGTTTVNLPKSSTEESNRVQRQLPKATFSLMGINAVIFIIFNIIYGIPICGDVPWRLICLNNNSLFLLAQVNQLVLSGERTYQLISSTFVHISFLHLLWNMLSLFYFGSRLEQISSSNVIIVTFFSAGFVAGLSTLTLGPLISLGASGAVFGVVGTYSVLGLGTKNRRKVLTSILLFLFLIHLPFLLGANINFLSHLAGFSIGALIGVVTRSRQGDGSNLSTVNT